MSDEIINSLITAGTSVICCFIGLYFGKSNSNDAGKQKILLQQLMNLIYLPIISSIFNIRYTF